MIKRDHLTLEYNANAIWGLHFVLDQRKVAM